MVFKKWAKNIQTMDYNDTHKVDESKLLKPFLWKALVKLKKRRARGSIMFKEQTKKKLCMASGLRSSPICSWHICFEEMRPNWASLSLSLPSSRASQLHTLDYFGDIIAFTNWFIVTTLFILTYVMKTKFSFWVEILE